MLRVHSLVVSHVVRRILRSFSFRVLFGDQCWASGHIVLYRYDAIRSVSSDTRRAVCHERFSRAAPGKTKKRQALNQLSS